MSLTLPRALTGALLAATLLAPAAARADDHAVSFPVGPSPSAYSPDATDAAAGDTVTFTGAFGSHPLVWTDSDFAAEGSGASHQYAFPKPGLYRFHCQIHTTAMTGSVHVLGNQFATPDFTSGPAAPKSGEKVTFTATAFSDPDGTIQRYEWDLDGNGTFETLTATGTASRTYSAAATVHVALRYLDDGHETSPATTHDVAVAAAPDAPPTTTDPGATTTPPGTTTGSGDGSSAPGAGGLTTQPADDLPAGQPQGATAPGARVLSRGVAFRRGTGSVKLTLRRAGRARVTLKAGRTVLARGSAKLKAGSGRVALKLTAAGRRRLEHGRRVQATLAVVLDDGSVARATISAGAS